MKRCEIYRRDIVIMGNVEYERYNNLDALRAISCLAIIAMHIRANTLFAETLSGLGGDIVSSFNEFVPLFLIISGFGMFCGYYERFKQGRIDINTFYTRRYKKILPFFVFLMLIDVSVSRSREHIIEALTQTTLVFGLVPNNHPEVLGVGWTLGVIFVFYMLFPFFVFCCQNRERALYTMVISYILSLFCTEYYFSAKFVITSFPARHTFLYDSPLFFEGGVLYLFRYEVKSFVSKHYLSSVSICIVAPVIWFVTPSLIWGTDMLMLKNMILFGWWMCCAISLSSKVLNNKIMHYLGGISLELYLAQMGIFRGWEKIDALYYCGYGWFGFIYVFALVVISLIIFIELWKYIIKIRLV